MATTLRGLERLSPILRIIPPVPASHPLHQLALKILAHIGKIIFTCVFLPHHLASRLDSIFLHFLHFVLFLFCFLLFTHRVFVFSSIFITEFELELYGIFNPCSWHVAGLGRNIFIVS